MAIKYFEEFRELIKSCRHLSVMISNLIDYLRRSGMKEEKFRKPTYGTIKEEFDKLVEDSNREQC